MARFTIMRPTAKGKSWRAVGINPKTGRKMTIQGGQAGTKVGPKARGADTAAAFQARHGTPKTPKQWINKIRWEGRGKIGSTVNIPNRLF